MCLADQPGYPWERLGFSNTSLGVNNQHSQPFCSGASPPSFGQRWWGQTKPVLIWPFPQVAFGMWAHICGISYCGSRNKQTLWRVHGLKGWSCEWAVWIMVQSKQCPAVLEKNNPSKTFLAYQCWLPSGNLEQRLNHYLFGEMVRGWMSKPTCCYCRDSDQLLQITFEAAQAAHSFLRCLYHEEVWIPSNTARVIADKGLLFLRKHGEAIRMAFRSSRNLFLQMPNLHRFHHIGFQLKWQSQSADFAFNPLALSSQCDEDFIGRPSRISRRVHARTVVERTLQRSLEAAYAKWVDAKLIILAQEAWGVQLWGSMFSYKSYLLSI